MSCKRLHRIKEIEMTLEAGQLALFIDSETSFYPVLHQARPCHCRWRARLAQEPRSVTRLKADRPIAL